MVTETSKTILDFLPQLEEALDRAGNTHTARDVARMIVQGDAQLWLRDGGMIVTEVEDYPRGPVLRFWLAAGDKDDILDLLPEVYEWGREVGCKKATMLGRKGWGRVLADDGWEASPLVHFTRAL